MRVLTSRATGTFFFAILIGFSARSLCAGDLKITLPKRSKLTPVQRLNREGVEAVCKHQYEKANALFYKAYLYDPNDPFTLNNLGYMAEVNGQPDRAQRLYELASQQISDAVIDLASAPKLKGEAFRDEVTNVHDQDMLVSRANVGSVHLLSKGRVAEAEALLRRALEVDPKNAFTLNNLGVVKEAEGDLESALTYYQQAAATKSSQQVIVTFASAWRDKPVTDVAAENVRRVWDRIRTETAEQKAARLNTSGVAAINRNDWRDADRDFREAYALDPANAFSLNNEGYAAEMSGDSETAQFFYQKARQAPTAGVPVGLATRSSAEGQVLFQVSGENDHAVTGELAQADETRRRQPGTVQLKHRDNTPVIEPTQPAAPSASQPNPPVKP
jgi:Flp pilus assembly protein TadD